MCDYRIEMDQDVRFFRSRRTHPFHPLSGREVACVGERFNRYGRRLLLRVDDVLALTPDGTQLYVGNYNSPDVSIIDLASESVSGAIPLRNNSYGIGFTPR